MSRRNRNQSGTPMSENTNTVAPTTDVVTTETTTNDTIATTDTVTETTVSASTVPEVTEPVVTETPELVIPTGVVGSAVAAATVAVDTKPAVVVLPEVTTTRFDSDPAVNSVEYLGWQSVLNDYLKTMAPGVANTKQTVCIKQKQLFSMILSVIRNADPVKFGSGMRLLLGAFGEHANRHFALTHILRGLDNIELSVGELHLIQLLFPALRTYALGKGTAQAYANVGFETVFGFENQFSEPEKQRLDAFLRVWCGVN